MSSTKPTTSSPRPAARSFAIGSRAGFLLLMAILVLAALRATVHYHDSYGILLNARAIVSGDPALYSWLRPHFLPVLLAPFAAWERAGGPDLMSSAHLLILVFAGLLVLSVRRLLSLFLKPEAALIGAILFGLNPIFLAMALEVKEDIPGALFVTLAFTDYLLLRRSWSIARFLRVALWTSLAVSTRYNLIPFPATLIILHEILLFLVRPADPDLQPAAPRELRRLLLFVVVLPAIVLILLPALFYPIAGLSSWTDGATRFLAHLFLTVLCHTYDPQPPSQYYGFLWISCTAPVILAALLGAHGAWKRRDARILFPASWFLLFFVVHAYVVGVKEARYLLPLLPPFYFFAADGLSRLLGSLSSRGAPRSRVIAGLLFVAVLLTTFSAGLPALARRFEPFYRCDFAGRIAHAAVKDLGTENRVYWSGGFYTIHPRGYHFHPEDEFTAMYAIDHTVLSCELGRVVIPVPYAGGDPGAALVKTSLTVSPGDIVFVPPRETGYVTKNVPASCGPLRLYRAVTGDSGTVTFELVEEFPHPTLPPS